MTGERPWPSNSAFAPFEPPTPQRPPTPSPRAPSPAFVVAVIGLAILLIAAGVAALIASDKGIALASPATLTAPATTLRPLSPQASVPTDPSSQPSTALPQSSATSSELTVGVVDIDTVLAYQQGAAAGTGVVLKSSGEVLTNNHVIDGATQITVPVIATGRAYTASVVGTDPTADIAVLQLDHASGLATIALGDSTTVHIGDPVIGVGNAGGRGTPTSTAGSVVDLGQTITATDPGGGNAQTLSNLIETSAALQPGQSGGPLYDANGKVVGLDAAATFTRAFRGRGTSSGGYAIPINDALEITREIESGKPSSTITIGTPPMLGIGVSSTSTGNSGALVTSVANASPAAAIGLQAGDLIIAAGTATINTPDDLTTALRAHKTGDKITITWTNGGVTHSATATLVAGPAN